MDFDETIGEPEAADEARIAAELREVVGSPEPGIETRQHKAMVAAALFDEPLTPVHIGRFTIVRKLGAGGMGVVYVAYDEQLDRRVAVKLLRRTQTDTRGRARLEREAMAMARLSHPNVVTVHEVGTHEGQVFVAMEFVEGGDLRAWLSGRRRDWRTIVEVFRQAGQGLAAAHQAGIVHRDFKPDNVLVGTDGRARVADFGLAHGHDSSWSSTEDAERDATSSNDQLERTLTRTGALMGTPAYMAPEQFAGKRADARADQFAFCVALWEGLYGARPFSGKTLIELSSAVAGGLIDEPANESEVPAWLRAALIRGLAPRPDDRWPSIVELLEVLANDPHARRRRRLRIAGLTGLAALILAGLGYVTTTALQENARRQYWSAFTEQLLEIERVRGVRQANDDALRARDAARMSVYRSYRPRAGIVDHEDPTVAAALLREVEGEARFGEAWISAANEILGQPLSYAALDGHRDVVTSLVFAPGEQVLYSGAADGEVWRWDLATGRGQPIIVHDGDAEVTKLALSPDGRTLLSASRDGTARAWSPGAEPRVVATHPSEITSVAFAPDGRRIVTSSHDGTAAIHELDGEHHVTLRGHTKFVYAAEFDSSGARVVTASHDNTARLWRTDGESLATLEGHEAPVFHARFIDADNIVTGSDDGSVRLWHLDGDALVDHQLLGRHATEIAAFAVHDDRVATASVAGKIAIASIADPSSWRIIGDHSKGVWALAFTPTGDQLVSASLDSTARLHDIRDRGAPRSFVGHRLGLLSASVDPRGRWLATGSYDGEVRVWDLQRPTLAVELEGHRAPFSEVVIDPRGELAITASHDGTARVWDARNGALLRTHASSHGAVLSVALSPDQRTVATASYGGVVELWDLEGDQVTQLRGHTHPVWRVRFDASGQRLASTSEDRTARIWSLAGEELLILRGHREAVSAIDLGVGDQPIATASHDSTVRLWSPVDGSELAVLRGHQGAIVALARSPTGTLATASQDGTARLWPDEMSEHSIALAGHHQPVWSVAFDSSGALLVTASSDGAARIWDAHDGRLLKILEGHSAAVWMARFVDSDSVLTISEDHSLRLWSLADERAPIVLPGHFEAITHLDISQSRVALTASSDRSAKIWHLDRLEHDPARLSQALEEVTIHCLSARQRERELGLSPGEAERGFVACKSRQTAAADKID